MGGLNIGLAPESERGTPTGPRSMKSDLGGEGGVGIGFDGYNGALHGERPPGAGYIGCGSLLRWVITESDSGGNGGRGEVGGG